MKNLLSVLAVVIQIFLLSLLWKQLFGLFQDLESMKKLSINSKGSSVSEHDSTPSSSTEDIHGAVQDAEQRSESPISFSLSRVRELSNNSHPCLKISFQHIFSPG